MESGYYGYYGPFASTPAVFSYSVAEMVTRASPRPYTPLPRSTGVECSFSAGTEPLLRAHTRREHSASLACPHCQLQFRQAAALNRHMATSHPNLPDRPSQVGGPSETLVRI